MPSHPSHPTRTIPSRLPASISDASPPASSGLRSREARYLTTMGFRVACFVAMIWVPGWERLILILAAAVLPYVAVIAASQVDHRAKAYQVEVVGDTLLSHQLTDRSNPAGVQTLAVILLDADKDER